MTWLDIHILKQRTSGLYVSRSGYQFISYNMALPDAPRFFAGVCWHCKATGSAVDPLQRCGGCQLVSYCSKRCQKDDRSTHKYVCKEFPVVDGKNVLHTTAPWEDHIASLLKRSAQLPLAEGFSNPLFLTPWVCNTCHESSPARLANCKCLAVSYCSKKCAHADNLHTKECSQLDDMVFKCSMRDLGLAYPRSLSYALLMTSEYLQQLQDLSTLVVHVVTGNTMMDSMHREVAMQFFWDQGFAHHFPNVNHLKMYFIVQGKVNPQFFLKELNTFECEVCETRGRVVTYSLIQQMKYHMFFSSDEYSKPDIVVIYGNNQEMSGSNEDAIHTEISYRNMTYSHDTVVVLMDATKDLVKQGVRAMNKAQPLEQIVSVQNNPFKGFTPNPDVINEKCYFTCLRRK